MPSHVLVFHLSGLAYQVRQKRSLRRLATEKPTHDQVASEQSRIKMTDAGGGDCKTQAKTRRDRTASSSADSHCVRTARRGLTIFLVFKCVFLTVTPFFNH